MKAKGLPINMSGVPAGVGALFTSIHRKSSALLPN